MSIGWKWNTPDGWMFHKKDKLEFWRVLGEKRFSLEMAAKLLEVKESWIERKEGDVCPPNFFLLKSIIDRYLESCADFKPPLLYRLAVHKIGIMVLALYLEDTAYMERLGGMLQHILDRTEQWDQAGPGCRAAQLEELRDWWHTEEWRQRYKEQITFLFNWIIEHYQKDPFIQKSIDFGIDCLLLNKENWQQADRIFNPKNWYPRGKGQVNYLCHGGIL
jgi:hypothetical protein